MKTFQLAVLILIVMSIMPACKKTNLNSVINPSNSTTENKLTPGPRQYIVPENFVSGITNPYLPLTPGDTLFYTNVAVEDGDTTIESNYVTTTSDIKVIQGISCEVVHDVVMIGNMLSED